MSALAPAGYLAGLAVALVLAVAAGAKLGRPRATAASFAALGLPAPVLVARAVPVAEIVTAVALATVPRLGAGLAAVLLAGFTVFIARTVAGGTTVRCACFGTSGTAPVSVVEIVRNLALIAGAGLAFAATAPRAPTLEAVVFVSTGAAITGVVLAMLALRRDAGAVFAVHLAGDMVQEQS